MADETLLIVLWTILAGLVVLFYCWKRTKTNNNSTSQRETIRDTANLKEARLKRFRNPDNAEIARSSEESKTKGTEIEDSAENDSFQKTSNACRNRASKKEKDETCIKKVILRPSSPDKGLENRHFDPTTGAPITKPLDTLEEAMYWSRGFDEFNIARVELPGDYKGLEDKPRTLVCHDMKGGYIEDRFVQGYNSSTCYNLYHWQLIDVFVYFSHHFITIPPPCWTNAAHTHNVPVLGTFITEWEDGATKCSEFLEDSCSFKALADQLVKMADYYNFDGWLINIENPVQPAQVSNLVEFVSYLTDQMHKCHPHSLVIWYDSVTYTGELKWQNELNSANGQFFSACDGVFLNYTWSLHQLGLSARAARAYGRAMADVYVGVDVFGRECYSGGGYKCNQAFRVIREEKLSVALFAPGWVMETQGVKNFTANEDRFWGLIHKACNTHISAISIPFVTSLCRGNGNQVCIDGKVVYTSPWTNLSCQQPQPTHLNIFFNMGGKGGIILSEVEHNTDEAFNGGGCQVVKGHANDVPPETIARSVVRLFDTAITVTSGILVSFTFKLSPADCIQVGLQLLTDRKPTYILLCPESTNEKELAECSSDDIKLNAKFKQRYGIGMSRMITSSPFMAPIGQEHYEAYSPLTGSDHDCVQRASDRPEDSTWSTRHYFIAGRHLVGCKLKEIRVVCVKTANDQPYRGIQGNAFNLHLGEIKILDPNVLKRPIMTVRNLRQRDVIWKTAGNCNVLSLTLTWDYPITSENENAAYYDVFAVKTDGTYSFIGRSFVESYRVCSLPVETERDSVEFTVQAVTSSRLKRPLNDCSRILFSWNS